MVDQAINAVEFFRNESCGKCVPCRIGSQKLAVLGDNLRRARSTPALERPRCCLSSRTWARS